MGARGLDRRTAGRRLAELFCQFRIERVDAKERLRRIEHQVFSVLKTVFLGVEDYPAMKRTLRELGTRLRGRPGRAAATPTPRAASSTGCAATTT